ncbi:hypothetical protein CAEBREN_32509, partial [Caenorhabditis brenneri]
MVRRQACLAINRNSGEFTDPLAYSNFVSQSVIDAKLSSMSSDEWSIFLFLRGLTGPEDAEAKLFLMQFVESSERKKEKLTLSTVYDEWIRFSQLKTQSKVVAPNKPAPRLDVNWVQKKSAHGKKQEKKPGEKDAQPRSPKKITCFSCGEVGHKSPDCPTKPTQGSRPKANASKSNTPKSTQIISVDGVDITSETDTKKHMTVVVEGQEVEFQLDTGSEITLLNAVSWEVIGSPRLEPVNHRITCANGSAMKVLGRAKVSFQLKGSHYSEFVYVREKETNLIGMSWISKSPVMREALDTIINAVTENSVANQEASLGPTLLKQFPQVFEPGLGLCKVERAKFRTVEGAKPIFKKARPVPYGSQTAVESELSRLQELGVIEPVTYSEWASPIVVTKKKEAGKVRACGDYKCSGLNASLQDECHPLPTSEDIFGRLQGKVFSQIDLRDAYLQVELDDESQKLAVINTHLGLFRYKRMAFGLKTAPAIFQKIMDKMISGIPGVAAYLDDLIVATDTVEEHREILFKLFDRIQEYGFRVSLEKCAFAQSEITFLGFIIDGNGRRPDHKKTAVIRNMQAPVNQKQLGSFLGAITFYSRFVKNISELRGPLDHLMRKDSTWKWTETEQAAFEVLKDAVAKNTMLSHFH